jgi:hypothetical protein
MFYFTFSINYIIKLKKKGKPGIEFVRLAGKQARAAKCLDDPRGHLGGDLEPLQILHLGTLAIHYASVEEGGRHRDSNK